MKTSKYFLLALVLSLCVGCENSREKEQKENATASAAAQKEIHLLGNESDLRFAEALKFLENKKNSEASKSIKDGISALKQEAEDVTGKAKENMTTSVDKLSKLASELEKGIDVPIYRVRELMANIKINAAYNYLAADDTYVIEDPQSRDLESIQRGFSKVFSRLKKVEGDAKAGSKKERDALIAEGEELQDQYDAWSQRTKEFNRKTNEYFKSHYPEYYMEKIGVFPND